jgi:hypothetical protein
MGLGRLLTGAAFLVFAISLAPGMFGARLGALDAYVAAAPRLVRERAGVDERPVSRGARPRRARGKRVFVNFTGYACTNCHWMKANMFTRPEIAAALQDFVLVELYTDGTDAASERNQALENANSRPSPSPTTPSWTRTRRWWRASPASPATRRSSCDSCLYSEAPTIELHYKSGITQFELNTLPLLLHRLGAEHPASAFSL